MDATWGCCCLHDRASKRNGCSIHVSVLYSEFETGQRHNVEAFIYMTRFGSEKINTAEHTRARGRHANGACRWSPSTCVFETKAACQHTRHSSSSCWADSGHTAIRTWLKRVIHVVFFYYSRISRQGTYGSTEPAQDSQVLASFLAVLVWQRWVINPAQYINKRSRIPQLRDVKPFEAIPPWFPKEADPGAAFVVPGGQLNTVEPGISWESSTLLPLISVLINLIYQSLNVWLTKS
jgi:hypothetical protein